MKFVILREVLLKPLQAIISVADKKHTRPVLSNILCKVSDNKLYLTASDLETEILAEVPIESIAENGIATIPARKLIEIVRNLPEACQIEIIQESANRIAIRSNKSCFILSTLDPESFPSMIQNKIEIDFTISQKNLLRGIKKVQFAMANNDVRYFLNGMLWELENKVFRTVATDGHRMAMSELDVDIDSLEEKAQIIIPRKAIIELQKLISNTDDIINLSISENQFQINLNGYKFTSKLIDGSYPDYSFIIPKNNTKLLLADRIQLKQALTRTAILSNEQYRGVRINIDKDKLCLVANNPEQEEAKDEIEIEYHEDPMEMGFNISYLLDVVNAIESEKMDIFLSDSKMSLLIKEHLQDDSCYVIMPIRL